MKPFQYPINKVTAFRIAAVFRSDIDSMRRFFSEEPDLFRKLQERKQYVACEAAKQASVEAIRTLIELGADVNERDLTGYTPLSAAVARGRKDVACLLLESGADPNLDCPIFQVASQELANSIQITQMLLDHGADINQPFLTQNLPPRTVLSEAIDRNLGELVEFLKSCGARNSHDLPVSKPPISASGECDYSTDVLAHVREFFGSPVKRTVQNILPSPTCPVVIGFVPASPKHPQSAIYFTMDLSKFRMVVPKGSELFERAELMVEVPNSWAPPEEAIKKPQWAWPIQWLRKIAAYAVDNNTWLGAQFTVLTLEEPPQPLGPGTKFTSWLLVSLPTKDTVVRCKDGTTIQIYQLCPLYTEEYEYGRDHGASALMELLVEHKIATHIDPNRPNVALAPGKRPGK